jgi:uncharacterized lipoprotein YmbA
MTTTTVINAAGAIAAIAIAGIAGCASAPPERFYTLSGAMATPARASADDPRGPTVVAPAAVPELVDRPQLVVSTGANQVAILEQQRWAEPLRQAIARVVAEDLGRQLGAARVSTGDQALRRPDCRVYLDVRRLDARRGVAVDLEALWTVTCVGGVELTGRSLAREPAVDLGNDLGTEAIVVAQRRALRVLARDLGQALRATAPALATLAARGRR